MAESSLVIDTISITASQQQHQDGDAVQKHFKSREHEKHSNEDSVNSEETCPTTTTTATMTSEDEGAATTIAPIGGKPRIKAYNSMIEELCSQLEYYFSVENLSKDTFLCSIMSSTGSAGNGAYGRHAPIGILSRFGNVKKIVSRYHKEEYEVEEEDDDYLELLIPSLLRDAALLSAELEVVVMISSSPLLGNSVMVQQVDPLLLAIGPREGKPLPYEPRFFHTNVAQPSTAPSKPTNGKHAERNTIILRDMPADATDQQVADIFSWDGCPALKNLHSDVANCWFATLDASEEQVISALLQLRSKTFNGQPIKARLKTESSLPRSTYYPKSPTPPTATTPTPTPTPTQPVQSSKPPPTLPNINSNKSPYKSKSSSYTNRNGNRRSAPSTKTYQTTTAPQPSKKNPPPLLESHFPALLGGNNHPPNSLSPPATNTTTAAAVVAATAAPVATTVTAVVTTATTTPPSTNVPPSPSNVNNTQPIKTPTKPVGGYAAALLKAPLPTAATKSNNNNSSGMGTPPSTPSKKNAKVTNDSKIKKSSPATPSKTISSSSVTTPKRIQQTTAVATPKAEKNTNGSKVPSATAPAVVVAATPDTIYTKKKSFAEILKSNQNRPTPMTSTTASDNNTSSSHGGSVAGSMGSLMEESSSK